MDRVARLELLLLVFLPRERPHDPDPGQVLLQRARHLSLGLVDLLEGRPHPPEEYDREDHDRRDHDDRDERHARVEREHERDRDDHHDGRAADLDDLVRQELAERLDVRGAALDLISRRRLVVIRARQVLDLVVEPVAHAQDDPLAGHRRPAAAQVREDAGDRGQPHQNGGGDPEVPAQVVAPSTQSPRRGGPSRSRARRSREDAVDHDLRHERHEVHDARSEDERRDGGAVSESLAFHQAPDHSVFRGHLTLPSRSPGPNE